LENIFKPYAIAIRPLDFKKLLILAVYRVESFYLQFERLQSKSLFDYHGEMSVFARYSLLMERVEVIEGEKLLGMKQETNKWYGKPSPWLIAASELFPTKAQDHKQ
jgi:hypothetical protein